MRIGIIVGSHRGKSESTKVGTYLASRVKSLLKAQVELVDLRKNPLPLWDEDISKKSSRRSKKWAPISRRLQKCDGFIVISPEWNGMAPAGLKNFFLYAGFRELGHKPALLVCVSAGRGGAYPVAELRMSSYKNSRLCYLPEHLIVRDVTHVLNGKLDENNKSDVYIRKRADFSVKLLGAYSKALLAVRESNIAFSEHTNGM